MPPQLSTRGDRKTHTHQLAAQLGTCDGTEVVFLLSEQNYLSMQSHLGQRHGIDHVKPDHCGCDANFQRRKQAANSTFPAVENLFCTI